MCIIDTNGEKKHCGVRPYQRTAHWEKLFFLPNGFGGQRPPRPPNPPAPQGATLLQLSQQTAVKTVAFLAMSGSLRDVLDSQPLSIAQFL